MRFVVWIKSCTYGPGQMKNEGQRPHLRSVRFRVNLERIYIRTTAFKTIAVVSVSAKHAPKTAFL